MMQITLSLASKLASVVVHADELFSVDGRKVFDETALLQAVHDAEVQAWIKSLGPLAPVKRKALLLDTNCSRCGQELDNKEVACCEVCQRDGLCHDCLHAHDCEQPDE